VGQIELGVYQTPRSIYFQWSGGQAHWHKSPPCHYLWPIEKSNGYRRDLAMPWVSFNAQVNGGAVIVHVGRNCATICATAKGGNHNPSQARHITPDEMEQALESLAQSVASDLAKRSLAGVALKVRCKERGAFALLKEATALHKRVNDQ